MAAEIDQILSDYVICGKILGASFQVRCIGNRSLYSSSVGHASFDLNTQFTENTVCWIASLTKLATAVATLQVVERGQIGLDDDLRFVLPEFRNISVLEGFDANRKPQYTNLRTPITLRHLLTHSSGFSYIDFDSDLKLWQESISGSRSFDEYSRDGLKDIPLKFQPGEGWAYSIGVDFAGRVVEALSGQSLEKYMHQNIFMPLGMASTTFRIADHPEFQGRRAHLSTRENPGGRLISTECEKPDDTQVDSGGAGLHSTASDYAKLLGALLDGGGGILTEPSLAALWKPQLAETMHMEAVLLGPLRESFCAEYPVGKRINHALGGAVNLEDLPHKRCAGSIMWSGVSGPRWWCDPKSGITATLFVQHMAFGDSTIADLYDELERTVYRHFGRGC